MLWGGRAALAALALSFVVPASAQAGMNGTAVAKRLGAQAVVQVDPATGTPRVLGRLNGALSAPASGTPESIADAYVRSHLSDLGLTQADLPTLGSPQTTTSPAGVAEVSWSQSVAGIPSSSSSLRVNVARDGRVINVLGSPAHDLSVATTTPKLGAGAAMAAVQRSLGQYKPLTAGAAKGATRATSFGGSDNASLELYQRTSGPATLAWRVIYDAGDLYAATVDAQTGGLLKQVDLTKSAVAGSVWERYPGATSGTNAGTQRDVDITDGGTWLSNAATTLNGPNVHAYSDVNNNDSADFGEEIVKTGGSFKFAFVPFTSGSGCSVAVPCSWSGGNTWTTNRAQNGVQAFYYANQYHDHLAAAPIGFTDHSFEGTDPLQLNTDDSVSAASPSFNNANMSTPPDGQSPLMQMYLFTPSGGSGQRFINGGDDAAILYHEYTHGLSSRLITDANGVEALNSAQSGAMGEGWSDWYAMDYLVKSHEEVDDPAVDGDVDMGQGSDLTPHSLRYQGLDCPVGSSQPGCPGGEQTASGGFTYADFGKIYGVPEVHADGEIWCETLWDLRDEFGSDVAEELITQGMRMSPPEPSFLDERNAIFEALEADPSLNTAANLSKLWTVFATRGMGYYAATDDSSDVHPDASFVGPPDAATPRGKIAGTLTDTDTGLPLSGASVGIAGLTTGADDLITTTDGNGHYELDDVPQGSYPRLRFTAAGYYPAAVPVEVDGGQTATRDTTIRRNWASSSGLATVSSNHEEYAPNYSCGSEAAIDQSRGTGWSTANYQAPGAANASAPAMTVTLPHAIDISSFALDPSQTCGDDISSMTASYKLETTTDPSCATGWKTSHADTFGSAQSGLLTSVTPAAGTGSGVTCVRLTLLSALSRASDFLDFTELAVYGTVPGPKPGGSVTASVSGLSAHFTAAFSEPGATITSYRWDFGDGSSATTTAAQTDHTYAAGGTYTATVTAVDSSGRTGSASVGVTLIGPAPTPTPTPLPTVSPTPVPTVVPPPAVLAEPSFTLPSTGSKGAAAFTVKCAAACSTTAALTVDAKTKRKLGLATLGTTSSALLRAESRKITIRLSAKAKKALKRHHLKSVTVTLKVTAHYKGAATVTSSRHVKIKV